MFTALCGVCRGADDWAGVVEWATMKLDWLRQYLVFDNGVASLARHSLNAKGHPLQVKI